jgi:hypothetical protein
VVREEEGIEGEDREEIGGQYYGNEEVIRGGSK